MNFWFIGVALIAFFCEYLDAALGMGYGTTLTPLLLLLGFKPLEVVPAVLLSQLVTSLTAGFFHHRLGNVNFNRGSPHLKIALILALSGVIGSIIAVLVAIRLSQLALEIYIGVLVLVIGILILFNLNRTYRFSWLKITGAGLIAAFNKGISGGGYGPIITGGQILSGLDSKNAIGITSLAEGLTCAVGFSLYFLTSSISTWSLAPFILVGALLSVPLSVTTVKKLNTRTLKIGIGLLTMVLGSLTLIRIIWFG